MWSFARYDLRLTEEEFWPLTPYELSLLVQRHRARQGWVELMAAVQPCLFAEAYRDDKKRRTPFKLEEFTVTGMAEAARKEAARRKKMQTPEGQAGLWSRISAGMKALGGINGPDRR